MAKDILTNEDGSLKIVNGDLVVGDADLQNLAALTELNKGEIKYDPFLGMDLIKLNKKRLPSLSDLSEINRQLRADNWINQKVEVVNGEIVIEAERAEQ